MKKLILILSVFFLCGCVDIKNLSYDEIVTRAINYSGNNDNIKRKGYSYTILNNIT